MERENTENPSEHLKTELRAIEEKIDTLHAKKMADPDGMLLRESFEMPDPWLDFIANAEDLLGLDKKEQMRMKTLVKKLLRGELDDKEENGDVEDLIDLKTRFEEARAEKETH